MVKGGFFMKPKDWKKSADCLKNVRYLAIMAAFIALKIILSTTYIPVSENLRISISFLVIAIEAAIIGPVAGMASGAVTDILSFILFPNGPFFIGYTLTAMLGELIYALFLYNTRISVVRIALAKFFNNCLVNVCLGSVWSSMLYGNAYMVYFVRSLIKNTILLPLEIILLVVLFNLIGHVLVQRNLISSDNSFPLPLFRK